MVGIEDREYKEDKVECKFNFIFVQSYSLNHLS
jgi:hypothetical protein